MSLNFGELLGQRNFTPGKGRPRRESSFFSGEESKLVNYIHSFAQKCVLGLPKKRIGACFLGTKQPAIGFFYNCWIPFFPKKSVATQSVPSVASCFVGYITSIKKDLQAQKAAFRQLRSKCLVMQMFLGKFRLELIPRRLLSRMFRQPRS